MQWVVGISSCQVNLVCSQVTRQSPERPQITWQAAFATVCTGVHRDVESSPVFTKPGPGDPTLGWTHAAVLVTCLTPLELPFYSKGWGKQLRLALTSVQA